jgi:hypothetical protein
VALAADLTARNAEVRSHMELTGESLANMQAQQKESEAHMYHQFAEMCKGERICAQGSSAELQSASKTIKSLEKEVKVYGRRLAR